jgi:hypothetical protein
MERAPICCTDGWKLVFAGSRFTKGAEKRYAPTEGELLAVTWALKHAHIFTKGCTDLVISTDHKPLLGILNGKPLENIENPRIVRLKEQTLSFNFVVQYNQGKWHRGPDALSRSPQMQYCHVLGPFLDMAEQKSMDDNRDVILALTEADVHINITTDDIKIATGNDPVMVELMENIKHGFPTTQHRTDPKIRKFFNSREHLWIQDEVIMFKNRVVVPKVLQEKVMQVLHSAHQGIEGMKSRASRSIYWPGLNLAIKQKRENCHTCNQIAPSQPREPIQLIPPAEYPFEQLCMDAFQIQNQHYLTIVDRYSSWLMVFHVRGSPQGKHIVHSLRSVFTTYGVPKTIYTDGGLPFQGQVVQEFLRQWKVNNVTSSAMYPQSNGRAELAVKTAKRLLRDNTASDGSLNTNKASQALLQYRNTPLKHLGLSPAQILFHRNLRDGMPATSDSLKPNKLWVIAAYQREEAFVKRNEDLTEKYNRSTKEMPILSIGKEVLIQNTSFNKRWLKYGTVVDRNDRKYTIKVHGSGRVITRNRKFLKPMNHEPESEDHLSVPIDVHQNSFTENQSTVDGQVRDEGSNLTSSTKVSQVEPRVAQPEPPADQVEPHVAQNAARLPRMLQNLLPYNRAGLKE